MRQTTANKRYVKQQVSVIRVYTCSERHLTFRRNIDTRRQWSVGNIGWNERLYWEIVINDHCPGSVQFTLLVLEHSLYSLISSGENSAFSHFAAAKANYYNLAFSFHQVPITSGWAEAAWHERFAHHLYPWLSAWPCATTCVKVVIRPPRLYSEIPNVTCSLWQVHRKGPH